MLYVMRVLSLPIVCQAKLARGVLALTLGALAVACARTGLYPGELDALGTGGDSANPTPNPTPSSGTNVPKPPRPVPDAPDAPPVACQPSPEVCNGLDDDCNGAVDELPAQACAGGGSRFCVAGQLSECPRRCDVCIPGSVRVCQNPYCTFWGEQECAADGQGFSHCREQDPPPECAATARKHQESAELEQCCLDNGYCCVDEFDLDSDGDRREMLGACADIACQ